MVDTPITLKAIDKPEEQQRGGSTFTVVTAKQRSSVRAFWRSQWAKRPNNNGLGTTASRRSCRYTDHGQRLIGERWPRRGGARRRCGRPRRRRVRTVDSQRNQSTTAGWVDAQDGDGVATGFSCDGGALQRRCELAGDEQGRQENRARKRRTATAPELYRMAKEARRSHGGVFPMPARSQGRHACA